MLQSLSIKNVVLIDQLVIEFQSGLCVLTGETGAGKSVLLDALGLALGVRAESGLVRKGEDSASVTAAFILDKHHASYDSLRSSDIEIEDDVLLLRRVVYKSGKSRAFINDQPVSVGLLRNIGDTLIEIHGQFETQGLLNPATHRAMLDEYAKTDRTDLKYSWDYWKREELVLEEMRRKSARAHEEEEYLRFSLEDLERLVPKYGEELELSNSRERLKHRETVLEGLNAALSFLNTDRDPVQQAWAELDRISVKAGEALNGAIDAISSASSDIAEAAGLIQDAISDLSEQDYNNLEEIDDRLYALRMQARKHMCTVDELPQKLEELSENLALINNSDESLAKQNDICNSARSDYIRIADTIREQRLSVAKELNRLVAGELAPLKMEKAKFITDISPLDEVEWGCHGTDRVQFLVSTNPGREPGSIHKIASGGEMSRFMLALKVIIAQEGSTHSFIFDEVDTGIGGATADAVGERLARLAMLKQVLVVTHAPQVAARANHHWIVTKSGDEDVITTISPLSSRTEKCEEIARMLAGANITDEARAAANKLLDAVQ